MHRVLATTFQALLVPWLWAALLFAGMVVQFSYHSWTFGGTPLELYLAKTFNIKELVIQGFTAEVVYRPLRLLAIELIYAVAGTNPAVYKATTVVQFAGVLWCLVTLCRVKTGYQALAACLALSCFVGLHTSNVILGFFPVSFHSLTLLGLLATAVLCMSAHRSWYPGYYFGLCLVLPLSLETGLLLPPILVFLWWAGAPGVHRRDVAWGLGGVALYAVVRTTFSSAGADVPWMHTESGLGFGQVDRDGFSNAFGQAPYLFWVYNVMANLMTVLFSEPRGGSFEFIQSLIEGNTPPWRWIHLATSLATTGAGIVVLTRRRLQGHHRHLLVLGCVLILSSSLLGFLYARDRVGLVTGAGYAILVFLTASVLVESKTYRRAGAVALVAVLLVGWTWRSAESMFRVRDRAFESYSDWVLRHDPERPRNVPDRALLATLYAASVASPPPDPRCTPEWTMRYFQRRLSNVITDCGNADSYGFYDGPVIHVRWVETLGDTQRTEIEQSLGLYRAEHLDGSTWRYRVPDSSPPRLGMIVNHDMVADTHGFDRGTMELAASAGDVPQLTDPLAYTSGWHPAEFDAAAPESTWRWTQQTAILSFANPNANAMFYLDYAAWPDAVADTPQTVTVRAGDQILQSFAADAAGRRLHRIPLPAEVLGTGDRAEIQIAVDRTFVPATLPAGGRDARELGDSGLPRVCRTPLRPAVHWNLTLSTPISGCPVTGR